MSTRKNHQDNRRIRIRDVPKDPPDMRKLASAIILLASAQAQADAQAQHEQEAKESATDTTPPEKGAA